MRLLPLLAAGLIAGAAPAVAQPARSGLAPTRLGVFGAWTAAWYRDGQTKVCYAFARPSRSQPQRGEVILTVSHRGSSRDLVALRAGYSYPRGAPDVIASVHGQEIPFYLGTGSAHARDGNAAIAAFRAGREAVVRGSHPSRIPAIDHFPLNGFSAAYDAISRECPAGARR